MTDFHRQDARRTDRQYRLGLSSATIRPVGLGNPEPDQPGSRGVMRVSSGRPETPLEPAKPAVSVKKSMTPEYLVCLEYGKRFKSLKRHLRTQYNMTPGTIPRQMGPAAGLPDGGSRNYAVARSQLAKKMGVGQQARKRKKRRRARTNRRQRKALRRRSQCLARIRANALDHRARAVGTLRRQVVAESEFVEDGERIGRQDLPRRAAGNRKA